MAEQEGSVTAHSYHTFFPLLQRQNRTVTSSSRDMAMGCYWKEEFEEEGRINMNVMVCIVKFRRQKDFTGY